MFNPDDPNNKIATQESSQPSDQASDQASDQSTYITQDGLISILEPMTNHQRVAYVISEIDIETLRSFELNRLIPEEYQEQFTDIIQSDLQVETSLRKLIKDIYFLAQDTELDMSTILCIDPHIQCIKNINSISNLIFILQLFTVDERLSIFDTITKILAQNDTGKPSNLNILINSFDQLLEISMFFAKNQCRELLQILVNEGLTLRPTNVTQLNIVLKILPPEQFYNIKTVYPGCLELIIKNVDQFGDAICSLPYHDQQTFSAPTYFANIIGHEKLSKEIIKRAVDLQSLYEKCENLNHALAITSALDPDLDPNLNRDWVYLTESELEQPRNSWSIWNIIQSKADLLVWLGLGKIKFNKAEFFSMLDIKAVELCTNSLKELSQLFANNIIITKDNISDFTKLLFNSGKLQEFINNNLNNLENLINLLTDTETRSLFMDSIDPKFIKALILAKVSDASSSIDDIKVSRTSSTTLPSQGEILAEYQRIFDLPIHQVIPKSVPDLQFRHILKINSFKNYLIIKPIISGIIVDSSVPNSKTMIAIAGEMACFGYTAGIRAMSAAEQTLRPMVQRLTTTAWEYRETISDGLLLRTNPTAFCAKLAIEKGYGLATKLLTGSHP